MLRTRNVATKHAKTPTPSLLPLRSLLESGEALAVDSSVGMDVVLGEEWS